ncbi:Rib/alpha-like domain-containing protein, partial [Limosilactobacillus reuteri]|uniref:Rib/alpha-like domain-containing protein n=1 Tax=Limosilactobacillus reuteri TaxID=1598 RepID=UPI001E3A1BFB
NKAQQTLDQANNQLAVAKTALDQATQKLANLQKVAANKAQVVTAAKETVKDDQAKLIDLNNHLADMKNAPAKLAAAKQAASQAAQVLADAKAELQKQQDALAPFTEAIKAAQAKVATAQKAADQASQAVKDAQSNLDQANNKLADAKMTDAQRYNNRVVVSPVNLTAGDSVPAPKLANALTLNDNNGFSLVVNNGTAAELPAGTTAQWANEAKVQADANNAGSYTEDVLVTFPDGSQTIVKVEMTVAAKEANGQTNEIRPTSATSSTANGFRSNNAKNAYTSNTDSNIMTREAYKASQKNKLPQTGNVNESGLVALGLALAATTVSLFGLKKREN